VILASVPVRRRKLPIDWASRPDPLVPIYFPKIPDLFQSALTAPFAPARLRCFPRAFAGVPLHSSRSPAPFRLCWRRGVPKPPHAGSYPSCSFPGSVINLARIGSLSFCRRDVPHSAMEHQYRRIFGCRSTPAMTETALFSEFRSGTGANFFNYFESGSTGRYVVGSP